jgi:hypothetical protein
VFTSILALGGLFVFLASDRVRSEGWLDRGDKLASIGSLLLTAVGVVVAVEAWRAALRPASMESAALLDAAEDELARLVARQWMQEASMRGLSRPEPIRVRWASTGRPVGAPAAVVLGEGMAGRPMQLRLRGDVTEIAGMWRALPSRQLVLIGSPGSGKTSAAVLLTCRLLADRRRAEPVPVLLPLASWNPQDQHLDVWLAARLASQYPILADGGVNGRQPAMRLVERGRVLAVLDGLDEMPTPLRAAAVAAINAAVDGGRPLVLTCRAEEYEEVIAGTGVPLARAAVVEIKPVTGSEAAKYLTSAGTDEAQRRWAPVVDHLREHPDGVLGAALSTPLMVYLARTIYSAPTTDPAALIGFAEQDAVERHLLTQFLPTVYAPGGPTRDDGRRALRAYAPDRAQRWLAFLARHLHQQGTNDLAWWRINHAIPRYRLVCALGVGIAFGIVFGSVYGLAYGPGHRAGHGFDLVSALVFGPLFGLAVGLRIAAQLSVPVGDLPPQPSRRPRTRLRKALVGLASGFAVLVVSTFVVGLPAGPIFGIAFGFMCAGRVGGEVSGSRAPQRIHAQPRKIVAGLVTGLAVGLAIELVAVATIDKVGLVSGLISGLVLGLVFGLLSGLVVGLGGPATRSELLDPMHTLHRDKAVLLVFGLVFGAAFGLVSALLSGRVAGPGRVLPFGLVFGLGLGLVLGFGVAWITFIFTRCWCGIRGELPFRTMRFLDDAHQRGVLRQVGAEYQFRHIRLQDHLASQSDRRLAPG